MLSGHPLAVFSKTLTVELWCFFQEYFLPLTPAMDAVAADNNKVSPTKYPSETPTKETPEITEEKQIEGTEKVSGNFKIWRWLWMCGTIWQSRSQGSPFLATPLSISENYLAHIPSITVKSENDTPHCTRFVQLLLLIA